MNSEKDGFHSDVVEFLNSEFTGGVFENSVAEEALRKLEKWEEELRRKLHPSSTETPQTVNFSEVGENTLSTLTNMISKHEDLQKQLENDVKVFKPIHDKFTEDLQSIRKLENFHSYLLWVSAIEMTNDLLEEAVKQNHTSEMVSQFGTLKQLWGKLRSSDCRHLKKFSDDILLYWHDILREKFGSEFQKVLKNFNWPVLLTSISKPLKTTPDNEIKFKSLFVTLLKIQLPEEYHVPSEENKINEIESSPFILPLRLMFEPLEKRFYFHFMGKKQTNRIERPEWCFYQILAWINDHESFLKEKVQPVLDEITLYSVHAFMEFMRHLVQLAMHRLSKDLPAIIEDEDLLGHAINEIFLFQQELQNLEYPNFFPTPLQLLSTEPLFTQWRNLEHKSALEKMDRLFNSETAWKPQYQEEENTDDDLQVPECAELFIMLLLTMTERYRNCLDKQHQISFMALQLELLDDFRLRLHQLSQCQVEETVDAKYCAILNGVHYVLLVLNEWSNLPFFLKLHSVMQDKLRPDSEESNENDPDTEVEEKLEASVFDEAIALLEHVKKDLIQTLCERVMLEIKAKSRAYRKEKWFCMPTIHDKKSMEVSPFAYPLLDIINTSLQGLSDLLSKTLFTNVWQNIARQLDLYIYEEMILQNSFSEGGANQLHFDMTRNLFPIFGCYTIKPENYFRLVKECCTLLNLSAASAMLLKDVLKEQENFKERIEALSELGVNVLSPSQSLLLLSQRNDLVT